MRSSEGDRIEVVGYSDVRVDGLLAWWFFSCVGDTNDLSEKLAVDFFYFQRTFRSLRPSSGGGDQVEVGMVLEVWWFFGGLDRSSQADFIKMSLYLCFSKFS